MDKHKLVFNKTIERSKPQSSFESLIDSNDLVIQLEIRGHSLETYYAIKTDNSKGPKWKRPEGLQGDPALVEISTGDLARHNFLTFKRFSNQGIRPQTHCLAFNNNNSSEQRTSYVRATIYLMGEKLEATQVIEVSTGSFIELLEITLDPLKGIFVKTTNRKFPNYPL